ncbi:hypothetical protein VTN77DRAFT_7895 [Rasamsonia byssochlamydoides]|uniref:uncharacterized protein n=1 Tax=Rasamsonia byssochlamydoides TaxID=89139 RepID=UPI003742E772
MWDLRMASGERGVANCSSTNRYSGNSDAVRDIRWSPSDGVMFATATDSGAIQCWDYRNAKAPQLRIAAHEKPCYAVDWHPDGKHLVSGGTDKQVKVWDFSSSAERRQKPTFQFRAPQAVVNVRWRPPCWVSDSQGPEDWQSTQLVTSYDKEDPRIHLWDLRRPHIPFRELDRYDTPAADLLWRSKDLLWTVGEAGAFTQTDIRYAPQVINQRPMCAVAWSPTGEFIAITQKRPRQRALGINTTNFFQTHGDGERSNERAVSQSLTDDSLDDSAPLTSLRQRQQKRPSKSLGNTPPGAEENPAIVPLEKALSTSKSLGPRQLGAIGRVPGISLNPEVFRYLAQQYAPLMEDPDLRRHRKDRVRALLDDLDHNAERAEDVSLVKLAQTWRIVKYAVVQELELRAQEDRRRRKERNGNVRKGMSPDGELAERSRAVEDTKPEKMRSHLFKGVMETEGPRRVVADTESTSCMTTPLAQPLPDSLSGSRPSSIAPLASLTDDMVDLQPLPPSVMSSHYGMMNSNDLTSDNLATSDLGAGSVARTQHQESQSSEHAQVLSGSLTTDQNREGPLEGPYGDQRSAPRAITGRAVWRRHESQGGSEDDYDQKVEDKRTAIRDYKLIPKRLLSYDPLGDANRPAHPGQFLRHDSAESFPMFSASTDSSHRAKSMGTSFSPHTNAPISLRRDSTGWDTEEEGLHEDAIAEDSSSTFDVGPSIGDPLRAMSFDDSLSDNNDVHLERPSSPPPLLVESSPVKDVRQESPSTDGATLSGAIEGWEGVTLPLTPELTASKPWSAQVILREAVRHYHSNAPVDIQSAAHLLHKIHALFYACEKILSYEECESIFKAYNEQLLRHSMYVEAAELRNLCVPKYPAVYEYAQVDTFINVYCYTCKRPYENPVKDNRRCHRCQTPQKPCPICLNLEPPREWMRPLSTMPFSSDDASFASNKSSLSSDATEPITASEMERLDQSYTSPRPFGSGLWSWCQGCGHGGHVACMTAWLSDVSISEGGCPTPGCMHDCGPGPRREQNRASFLDESQRRDTASGRKINPSFVKRDTWATGESKAVEKVRGMLSVAASNAGGGAGAGATGNNAATGATLSSGGTMSPKKVRLVTPGEQGKRKDGSGSGSTTTKERESTSDPFPGG